VRRVKRYSKYIEGRGKRGVIVYWVKGERHWKEGSFLYSSRSESRAATTPRR